MKAQGDGLSRSSTFASKPPRVGDWVIAIGNPFGLGGTVTAGIVSARGRDIGSGPYDDFLQIDAPVNHGDSGGPTFNAEGEVVGVNTAIFSPSGGSIGIGFAIASDVVRTVVDELKGERRRRPRLARGAESGPAPREIADSLALKGAGGALVSAVEKNWPAGPAGMKSGDVIVAVGGAAVANSHDLARRIASIGPKKTVAVALVRNGAPLALNVKLGSLPAARTGSVDFGSSGDAAETARLGLTLRRTNRGEGRGLGGGRRSGQPRGGRGPAARRRHPGGRRQGGQPSFGGRPT